jgi:hypothetical protein
MPEKKDGPQHLDKLKPDEDQPPTPKLDFKGLRPPGAEGMPVPGDENKAAAIHAAQAAASKTEDRLKQEPDGDEPDVPADEQPEFDPAAFDAMAQNVLGQFQLREQLQTEEQRKIIEARLEESGKKIKLSQMYEIGEFRQVVPIIPGEFEPEFRTITPEEDNEIKLKMSNEPADVSLRYLNDKYAVISMLCALRKLNDTLLPEHFTNAKGWNEKTFLEKTKIIRRMPVPAVWSLMVHNIWFEDRCRQVFKLEDLKNG